VGTQLPSPPFLSLPLSSRLFIELPHSDFNIGPNNLEHVLRVALGSGISFTESLIFGNLSVPELWRQRQFIRKAQGLPTYLSGGLNRHKERNLLRKMVQRKLQLFGLE